jgi:hypothetical protein
MVKAILEKLRTDGSVIYFIDRQKKTGEYVINSDSSQAMYVAKITLHGFEGLPTGMYSSGFGFTDNARRLLSLGRHGGAPNYGKGFAFIDGGFERTYSHKEAKQ